MNWAMIWTIARRERLEMTRDGRFRWAGATILALLLVSLGMGWKHASEVGAERAAAQNYTRQQWLNQGTKNPHLAAHFGIWVFKPVSPLSLADAGIEPYTGIAAKLEAHNRSEFKFRPARDATAVGRFGQLSAALTLQLLVPLLIVLLCFGSFVGERERGTLRQTLSLGVPRASLAWGKALGAAGALLFLLLPAAVVGAVALCLGNASSLQNGDIWARAALMALGYALYFGAFVGVSLGVSALASSSRAALLLLLCFWVVNSLVLPRAVADLGRRLYATPSQLELLEATQRDVKNGVFGGDTLEKREKALQARLLKQYRVASLDELTIDTTAVSMIEAEAYGDTIFDRHWGGIWRAHEQQNALQLWGALLAPLPAMRDFSMGMAGTDSAAHQHLSLAAETYRREMVRAMNVEWAYHSTEKLFLKNVRGHEVWERLPPFSYQPPRANWALSQHLPALGLLGLWFGLGALVCALGARKMRVD